jgi:diadenosine tetraphosphatase ApaH/serine/threonine PP2A family protein phosphatase
MRYLVLSDIHSNLEALQSVLNDAGSIDGAWCLGDVVGYGPDPNACVELLSSFSPLCIAGNHDWATLGKLNLNDFNPDARQANLWTRGQLTPKSLEFLLALPETMMEGSFTLAHGSPRHPIWEYVIYGTTALESFAHFDTPYCFVGHTHIPVVFHLGGERGDEVTETVPSPSSGPVSLGPERLIVNPGSVGQPRDGDPRASYALLDTDTQTIEHRRVSDPFRQTHEKMVKHGLPMRLATRLQYGW